MSDADGKQLCDILRLNAGDSRFSAALDTLISWDSVSNTDVEGIVSAIITDVRQQGDSALLEYTNRFDRRDCSDFYELCIDKEPFFYLKLTLCIYCTIH